MSLFSIISVIVVFVFTACFTPILAHAITEAMSSRYGEIANMAGTYMIHGISSFLCFMAITFILFIIKGNIRAFINGITILRIPDKIGGAAVGLAKSLIVVWAFFVIKQILSKYVVDI